MAGIRRSSLQVALDRVAELEKLEKQKAVMEKKLKTATNPISLALVVGIAKLGLTIAAIGNAIKRSKKRRKKA